MQPQTLRIPLQAKEEELGEKLDRNAVSEGFPRRKQRNNLA